MRYPIVIAMALCPVVFAQQNSTVPLTTVPLTTVPLTTKTAKIEEIFRLTKTDQMQKQMMVQMSAMMKQQMASTGGTPEQHQAAVDGAQKAMEFTAQKVSWDVMKPDFIKLYDETYTEDEISGILMFYQSAPGQAMLAKTPVLMANTMAMIQKRMAEIMPELQEMIKKPVAK